MLAVRNPFTWSIKKELSIFGSNTLGVYALHWYLLVENSRDERKTVTGDPENNDKHDYFFSAIPKKAIALFPPCMATNRQT
jgi:hypothetical protein